MLALTRKVGEKILIGPDVVLEVVSIRRGQVRIALKAPRDIKILRAELLDGSFPIESFLENREEKETPLVK